MKSHIHQLTLGLSFILLATACGKVLEGTAPPPDVPQKVSGEVCFDRACAPVVDGSSIEDWNNDYVYPDHSHFPDENRREQYRAPHAYLDLKVQSGRLRIAENFLLSEFVQIEKGRYGIVLPILVRSLQFIRDALKGPLYITSGFRSPGYNAKIDGSAVWSRHMYGDAADLYFPSLKKLEKECVAKKASFVLVYTSHVHCDWRDVELHEAFYPPKAPPVPSPAFITLAEHYSRQMQVEQLPFENGMTLTVTLPDMEIEGDLVYRWLVYTPEGVLQFDDPFINLPRTSAAYYVQVTVGETLHTEAQIQW